MRRAITALAVGAALLAPPSYASAQVSFFAGFAPGCSPAAGCTTAQFLISIASGELSLNTLTITLSDGPYQFLPTVAGGTVGTYVAEDQLGPFGGFTTIAGGGSQMFIDFLDTGDPANPGFPFTLSEAASGVIETDVTPDASGTAFAFSYTAELSSGETISGVVGATTVVPEPATIAMVASGLLGIGGWRRRNRTQAA